MKINEIIIREKDPQPISAEPSEPKSSSPEPKPKRPTSSAPTSSKYTPGEMARMQFTYRKDKEFVRFVQYAISLPHIDTLPQAIAYANTELAARRAAKIPSKAPIISQPGRGMSGPSLEPRIGSTYGISRTKTGKGAIGATAGDIPGLDLVKQAGAKIIDYVGDTAQSMAGVDPANVVSVTKTVASFLDPSIARGQKIAKDIRS